MVGVAAVTHLAISVLLGGGLEGYLDSWRGFADLMLVHPYLAPLAPAALGLLYKGVELWRNPGNTDLVLPDYPPVPDLRWEDSIYIGSGWTRDGKQPGDVLGDGDELFAEEPHVLLAEKGLFGNVHCKGAVGSGKTSTLIMPVLDQGIHKYPKPPSPGHFPVDPDGRIAAQPGLRPGVPHPDRPGDLDVPPAPEWGVAPVQELWNPYVGMTIAEAAVEHAQLLALHEKRKWGMFILDPKGDLTEFVLRSAALAGREDDVVVLRPDGEWTYNPLLINANSLVQAEIVMDGIEAGSGEKIPAYWRSTQSEWLSNALTLLKLVDPTRVTFTNILRLARQETMRASMVSEAESMMRAAQDEEEELKRLGHPYGGPRIDPGTMEFWRDWDNDEADPKRKQEVVSGIKAQGKFLTDAEMAPFLCPEMPATFRGFEKMIDRGQIVVLRMPLDMYGPVARVLGILVLADAQQAARARINNPQLNQERVVLFVIDEVASYLNRLTKEFVSQNRQSRVCFMAAHQSQGQLIQHNDRSFETSFNDNLRTKISLATPNAESARREAAIFGSRAVFKERYQSSQALHKVERTPGSDEITPVGTEGQSESVSWEEVERPWFSPEDFMSLQTGEAVVMGFDGNANLTPRRVITPALYRLPRFGRLKEMQPDPQVRPPHPLAVITTEGKVSEYVGAALSRTGYVIAEPLGNRDGDLEGFKFITSVGTLILPCHMLEGLREVLIDRLHDSHVLVAFTDISVGGRFLAGEIGLTLDRALDLAAAYRLTVLDQPGLTYRDIFEREMGRPLSYPVLGGWEYHLDGAANSRLITQDSRDAIDLYTALGARLLELGRDRLEELYSATAEQVDRLGHELPDTDVQERGGEATAAQPDPQVDFGSEAQDHGQHPESSGNEPPEGGALPAPDDLPEFSLESFANLQAEDLDAPSEKTARARTRKPRGSTQGGEAKPSRRSARRRAGSDALDLGLADGGSEPGGALQAGNAGNPESDFHKGAPLD
jgi:hypothetical protein